METPLYSVSLHHAWDLQLKPGLPLLNVWVCVCARVRVVIADLHISFASHNKFIFNSANCQSSIKVCVTAFWLFALIRNRTLSTMVCVYMCACIVMIPPMGGMVLILVFTLYKYFQCFFWPRSFFNYLRTEKIGFTILLACRPCTDIHKLDYYCAPLTAYYPVTETCTNNPEHL